MKKGFNNRQKPQLVDLSHTISAGLKTYKGLPAPVICDYLSREESRLLYEDGSEFHIARIDMVSNTGTYIDCPFHRFAQGKDLSQLGLEYFTDLEGLLIDAPFQGGISIDKQFFQGLDLKGKAVLIKTGWDQYWNSEAYYEHHPYVSEEAAQYLKAAGVRLVGIDSHNIDDTQSSRRPVHSTLLGADILIVEHLCNLAQLPREGFSFTALPPKIQGVGTFPVRAMAKIYEHRVKK